MNFTWKDLIYIGIIIAVLILWKTCDNTPDNTQVKQPTLQPTEQKKDKKGTTYTEIKGTLYTQAQMKHITDSIARVLGKGKVTQVTQTVTDIDTVVEHDTLYVDLSTGDIYAADSNANFRVSYKGNYKTNKGQFHLALTPDTATYISTLKKRLFRADEYTTNVYHTNLLFNPSDGYTYTSRVPKVLGAIGPVIAVGYGTGDKKVQGFVGVGAVFNVISIKSR